jgi:peptidoglycan-N-acetylglucosamine deacetylase
MTYGSVQIDVDGWWTYAASFGEGAPLDPDPVFRQALPRLRAALDRHAVRATLFVVGADMAVPWKRRLIAAMAGDGHEIANHTFRHPLGLLSLPPEEIANEIDRAAEAIADAVGVAPAGFRAPGYAVDETVVALLAERGYRYDSSVLPTFWGAALRAGRARGGGARGWQIVQAATDRGSGAVNPAPPEHFGLAPLGPYRPAADQIWRRGQSALWEVPVTTMPLARVPFHSTCVFGLGSGLFRLGHAACRLAGVPMNYVFHAIDLIDDTAGARMLRRLGVRAPLEVRERLCDMILRSLARTSQLLPTRDWVIQLAQSPQHTPHGEGERMALSPAANPRLRRAVRCAPCAVRGERSEP